MLTGLIGSLGHKWSSQLLLPWESRKYLTARADSTFLGAIPDAIARAGPHLCCLGSTAPSPSLFPLWQVHSVHLECGVRAQPVQLGPLAVPWSFGALRGGCHCPLAVGSDTAQITAIIWTKLCFQMSLVGASFHRNICCRSQEGSVGSFLDLNSQHSWLLLQDTLASVPAPLTGKQEGILRKCLAWCCSQHPQHGFVLFR